MTTPATTASRPTHDPLALALRLLEARETLQRLWGAEYTARIASWRSLIRQGAANAKCSPLLVPQMMAANARKAGNEIDGIPLVALLAAAADEAEGLPQ